MRLAITAFLVAITACTSGGSSTGISELTCPPDSTLTYATFGQQMIGTHCMRCHDTESPQLGTQAEIQARAPVILDLTVYTDEMPLGGGLTVEQRRQLGEWLACGAP